MATTKRTRADAAAKRMAEQKERAATEVQGRRAAQVVEGQKRKEKKKDEEKKASPATTKKPALAATTKKATKKPAPPSSKKPAPPATKNKASKGKAKRKLTPLQIQKKATKKKPRNNNDNQPRVSCAAEMAATKNNHVGMAQQKALWDADVARILEEERRLEESESESNDEEEPLDPDIQHQIHETEKHHLSDNCRRDCGHRIRRMMEFWKQSDKAPNGCVERAVRKVPLSECNNESNWFCANRPRVGPFKEDLCHDKTSADCCKHFLGAIMIKEDGDCRLMDDVRKFRDAIMWGAKTAKQFTPPAFHGDIETFHKACRKKHANAGKKGDAQDTAADPITLALCEKPLEWSLDENDIHAWHWTQQQWNLMAPSANVDPLKLHNFRLGIDSIMVKFDESEADEQAQRLALKNVCAHPFDFRLCHCTGLGVCVALWKVKMKGTESLFLSKNAKEGSASESHVEQLQSIVDRHEDVMQTHMSLTGFNPCGLWKGAVTHATSGTTLAPSVPAVARRGEWSLSGALDCHWHFGNKGDQCLGRVLTRLDPTASNFDCLPPHFDLNNPMSNPHVERAMKITFGDFLGEHPNFTQISFRCLASIVHHKQGQSDGSNVSGQGA